ncbi:MAG: LacI family transcriptional regulator [Hyphomicrobiaceae bacterium]|nr:MAG: LacI family transcriptional regulator [Hyphomicrobiaceae bacterium]
MPDRIPRAGRAASSLKDVARLAGVSTATVSRAINAPAKLDTATLDRVQSAIGKLRYVPNGQARALRSRRSYTIGAVVPSFDYALYARTTSALERELEASGYALLLGSHHYDLKTEVRVTRALIERGVDAFMFVGTDHDPELFVLLEEFRRPYVLAWGLDRSGLQPTIGFDSQAATYAVAEHLVRLGHRRFGLISAPHAGNDRARERCAGVYAALQAHGLAPTEGAVQFTSIALEASTAAMERILALPHRPTAVLATNDVLAVGAMSACRRHGVRIPEGISITGVDNTDLGATQTPGLTSVRTPIVEIGRASGAHLIAKLEGRSFELRQEFPFELVLRGSTGRAPAIAFRSST